VNNPEQEIHQPDLQTFLFDLTDMHRLIPRIEEVVKFPNGPSVKQNLEKLALFSCVSSFETNSS
jgi:hypothetical protein